MKGHRRTCHEQSDDDEQSRDWVVGKANLGILISKIKIETLLYIENFVGMLNISDSISEEYMNISDL